MDPFSVHEVRDDFAVDSEPVVTESTTVARSTVHESTTDETTHGTLDERTRETLRRLSRLIVEKTTEHDKSDQDESAPDDESPKQETPDDEKSLKAFLSPNKNREISENKSNSTELIYMTKSDRALKTYNYAKQAGTEEFLSGQFLKLAV